MCRVLFFCFFCNNSVVQSPCTPTLFGRGDPDAVPGAPSTGAISSRAQVKSYTKERLHFTLGHGHVETPEHPVGLVVRLHRAPYHHGGFVEVRLLVRRSSSPDVLHGGGGHRCCSRRRSRGASANDTTAVRVGTCGARDEMRKTRDSLCPAQTV